MSKGKLTLSAILNLVSWNTLTASIFPFLIGVLYSQYHYHSVNGWNMVIYFIVALTMDLIVNVMDNLNDYEVAMKQKAVELLKINPVYNYHLTKKQVLNVVRIMCVISLVLGFWLVIRTSWILLILGLLAMGIVIFYSKFFQNTAIGEILSGLTMGFLIIFSGVYINEFSTFTWSLKEIGEIFLVSLPNTLWIANMMLANNICDIRYDKQCGRNTYPIKVGVKKSISAFIWFNIFALVSVVIAVILKLVPWTVLLILLITPFVYKQCKIFKEKQDKGSTFLAAVKILAVASLVQFITFLIKI